MKTILITIAILLLSATNFAQSSDDKFNVQISKAMSAGSKNDFTTALFHLNEAIKLDSINYEAYYWRGIAKKELNMNEAALSDFSKIIQIKPEASAAYFERGIIKAKLNKLESAIDDYNKVIELVPNDAEAFLNRGLAKYSLATNNGKNTIIYLDEACKDIQKAFNLGLQTARKYLNYCR